MGIDTRTHMHRGQVLSCELPLQLPSSQCGPVLPVFSVPLLHCHDDIHPPHLSGVTTCGFPQGRYPHSMSQVLSFHTSICLSIHPTIHLSVHLLPAICLSDEAMILLLISALWTWSSLGTNFTPTHTHTLKPLLSATLVRAVWQLQETETWRG